MPKKLTVRELADSPELKLELLAGERGLDEEVIWTHSSELEDPSVWLDGGELLISLGIGIGDTAADQVVYLERLIKRRVVGLLLGGHVKMRPKALKLAEEAAFPILLVPYEIPFSAITRMVADAQGDTAQRRLFTHVRIFDTLRMRTERTESVGDLFERLEELSGYSLYVITRHGASPLPGLPVPPSEVLARGLGDLARPNVDGGYAVPVWSSGEMVATLVALEIPDREGAGLSAIRHIATVASIELGALYRQRDTARRDGAELLLEMLTTTADPEKTADRLQELGLDPAGGLIVAVARPESEEAVVGLHHHLIDLEISHLMLTRDLLYLVLEATAIDRFEEIAREHDLLVGISGSWTNSGAMSLARREARWALERAEAGGAPARFEDDDAAFWLPADVTSLRQLVSEVLGPVIEYDEAHDTELLTSLLVYFDHDRRLSEAAELLYVHKHTLAYRLKRIEALTERKLSRIGDVAQLWLATRALRITDDLNNHASRAHNAV